MNKFEELVKNKLNKKENLKNLKITIDNSAQSISETNLFSKDEQNEDEIDQMDGIELAVPVAINSEDKDQEDDETEFHVNLDKAPPGLQNTILNEKIYLNESINETAADFDLDFISPNDLSQLYESLNLTESNFMDKDFSIEPEAETSPQGASKKHSQLYRREALHLFGVDNLNTNEIFDFFKKFKPFAVEWINDSSCNIAWKNETHAANALLHLTVPYESSDPHDRKSPSLSVRLPPQGNKWRKAKDLVKDKFQIYLRYVRKTDRKVKGAESRSKFYVRNGNPNYGNLKGLISNSKRKEMKVRQMNEAVSDLSFGDSELNQDEGQGTAARKLVSYNFDQAEDLSSELIEEFGTGTSSSTLKSKTSPSIQVRINNEEKMDFKRKKMRLYADDIGQRRNVNRSEKEDDEEEEDEIGFKKQRTRYEPYSAASKHTRSNVYLKDRLSTSHSSHHGSSGDRYRRHDRREERGGDEDNDLRNKLNSLKRASNYR